MLIDIDQQQKQTQTLQEYIQKFLDLYLKSSGLLPQQAKDFAHVTHFICNLHNQKLQHYVLGKNPASVQNAIILAQKKDAELYIIEGLHNHDPGQEITISLINIIRIRTVIQDPTMVVKSTLYKRLWRLVM